VAAVTEVTGDPPELSTLDDAVLSAYQRRLTDIGARTMTAELAVAASTAGLHQQLQDMLARHLGAVGAATAARRLTTGAGGQARLLARGDSTLASGPG
jgi:hypothetical protein